ncbi:hypothetical protein C8R44DRAFT_752711 [Mycena epipterygia]|nr:hypothetical protein C8R44DRAFT_752711 [Mycena epipterygia]
MADLSRGDELSQLFAENGRLSQAHKVNQKYYAQYTLTPQEKCSSLIHHRWFSESQRQRNAERSMSLDVRRAGNFIAEGISAQNQRRHPALEHRPCRQNLGWFKLAARCSKTHQKHHTNQNYEYIQRSTNPHLKALSCVYGNIAGSLLCEGTAKSGSRMGDLWIIEEKNVESGSSISDAWVRHSTQQREEDSLGPKDGGTRSAELASDSGNFESGPASSKG